jgi:hypothetical protein
MSGPEPGTAAGTGSDAAAGTVLDLTGTAQPIAEPAPNASRRAASRVLLLAPVALVVVAEAAWISVVGGLIQEFTLHQPELGIAELAVVVGIGAIAAHVAAPRLGRAWPFAALALVVLAAAVGMLASGAARGALTAGIVAALAAHPGGLLAGLAMLRGFAHARLPLAEGTLTRLLAFGTPGLAFAALMGGLISEPYRSRFLADTLIASVVFVGSTVLALAFARLGAVGGQQGVDWRRNPAWLALTLLLLVGAIALSLPMAVIAGTVLSILIGVALGPMLIAGLAAGFDKTGRRVLFFLALVVGIIAIRSLFGTENLGVTDTTAPGAVGTGNPDADRMMTIGLGGLLVAAIVAGILLLVALWMLRTKPPEDEPLEEERVVDRGGPNEPAARRARRFGRRPTPVGAVEAYTALLEDLEKHPVVRRLAGETPTEHAARIRAGGPELSLDLLAADYGLARYGGLALTAAEHRRAVERWRELRKRLAARVAPPTEEVEGEPTAVEVPEPGEGSRTGFRAG